MIGVMAKAFLSFALIIFLMIVIFYMLKKFYPQISSSSNSSVSMRVYAQLQLQPRKTIYLVRVLNKVLILGASENSLTILSEIDNPEIIKVLDQIYINEEKKNGKIFKLN
jgi:flagellar biosynthetic protein FliO